MNSCYAKWVNQLHDVCVNQPCTCCGNVLETSRIASRLCVCVRVCVCVLGWLSQLVPQQQCEWLKTTPRCVYKMVRRPCNIPLMAEVNAASNNKWTCEASWRHEAESVRAAKQWLYKIQPLRQQKAIGTVFVIVARFGAHLALFYPTAILQSEGFWQHKGLKKS